MRSPHAAIVIKDVDIRPSDIDDWGHAGGLLW
jgi:hypothetical protein